MDVYQARVKHLCQNQLKEVLTIEGITQSKFQNTGGFSWSLVNGVCNHSHYPIQHTRKRILDTLNLIAKHKYTEVDIWQTDESVVV